MEYFTGKPFEKEHFATSKLENTPNQQFKSNVYSNLQLSRLSGMLCKRSTSIKLIK
jgi:hypothetical protein